MKSDYVLILIFALMALTGIWYFFVYNREIKSDEVLGSENQLHILFNPEKLKFAPLENSATIVRGSEPFTKLENWIDKFEGRWERLEYDIHKPIMDISGEQTRIQILEHEIVLIFNNKNGYPRAYTGHAHLNDFEFLWELRNQKK